MDKEGSESKIRHYLIYQFERVETNKTVRDVTCHVETVRGNLPVKRASEKSHAPENLDLVQNVLFEADMKSVIPIRNLIHEVPRSSVAVSFFGPNSSRTERRKAHLVAQGFSQQPGIHFQETFARVARFSSIRVMASLAA
jgi:hypothetical protein